MRMARGFFNSDRAPHSLRCGVWLASPSRKCPEPSRTVYRPLPLRIAAHQTHGTNQSHRITPNRFGKAIRRNSAPVRQGFMV